MHLRRGASKLEYPRQHANNDAHLRNIQILRQGARHAMRMCSGDSVDGNSSFTRKQLQDTYALTVRHIRATETVGIKYSTKQAQPVPAQPELGEATPSTLQGLSRLDNQVLGSIPHMAGFMGSQASGGGQSTQQQSYETLNE
jgi:hypothetical protein